MASEAPRRNNGSPAASERLMGNGAPMRMKQGIVGVCMVVAAGLCGVPSRAADAQKKTNGNEIFAPGKLWTVHLKLTADRWDMMEPTRTPRIAKVLGGGGRPVTQPTTRPAPGPGVGATTKKTSDGKGVTVEGEYRKPNSFGFAYAYVKGDIQFDNELYSGVGVRFKGNSSYASAAKALRRPFKLDFNRFDADQKFHGMTQINLNNNAYDETFIRETLSYEMFREAGVPASRTALALMYVTIKGRQERECLGVYTLVEEVNKGFLKQHFGSSKGLLMKPERVFNLAHLGEDWKQYEDYGVKLDAPEATRRRFIEFTKLLHQSDDKTFREKVEQYLAVDEFLRFVAVNALLSNLDSFLSGGHNYYIYVHEDGKVYFLPWDLNLSFAGIGPWESADKGAGLSVMRPWTSENRLIQRVLAIEEYKSAYRAHVQRLIESSYSRERMLRRIEELEQITKRADAIARSDGHKPSAKPVQGLGANMPELRQFVTMRVQSVGDQLAGKTQGVVLSWERKGKMPRRPMVGVGMGELLAKALLHGADANNDEKLSKQEVTSAVQRFCGLCGATAQNRAGEQSLGEAMDLICPPSVGGGKREEGVGGFAVEWRADGPGALLARMILREADENKDRRMSADELLKGAMKAFDAADEDDDDALSEEELLVEVAELMNPREREK